jgi:hypothetical protein
LFSFIVDAFPGDSLGVGCTEFYYTSAEDSCTGSCSGGGLTLFPAPSSANTALSVSLGTINCQPEEFIDLPILVSSSITLSNINFDFAVVVNNTAPDGFYAAPEFTNDLGGTSPDVTILYNDVMKQYVVKLEYTGEASGLFFGTNIQLGTIRIYRPPVLCQGYTLSATLAPGRIRVSGGLSPGCRAVQIGATATTQCVVPAMPECSEEFQFDITTEEDLDDCSVLKVYATLSWDPADFGGDTTLSFNQLRAMLDFNMDNGVTIVNAQSEGFSCPGSGNDPVTCPGPSCLPFAGNSVELCINVGSPITVTNHARIVVTFSAPTGCVQGVVVRKMALKRPGGSVCQPDVNAPLGFPYCSPMMANFIRGNIATEMGCKVEDVVIEIAADSGAPSKCNQTTDTGIDAYFQCEPYTSGCLCEIGTAGEYFVTPSKNDNPLNGVTTYDLVLISKHILALEPLNSPYKMIAADANKSGSITTFDIIGIRKLILGIDTVFPNNNSWRFVDRYFAFPDTTNPFETVFPEVITLSSLPDTMVDFTGIKVGDVNNTVVTDCDSICDTWQRPAGVYNLREPRRDALKAGQYYTLPIRAGGESTLIAWQSAFRFDPELLELVGPSVGDVPGLLADNFNLAQASDGIIRASWFAQPDAWEEASLKPGQALFNLTFRVKQDLPENVRLVDIDESLMPNLGWTETGTAYALQTAVSSLRSEPEQMEVPIWLRCQPNPSAGAVTFDVLALPQPRRAQLAVFDAFGRRMWWRDLGKETGPLQINVPEAAAWPAGVYHWELRFDKQRSNGTFVRQ